MTYITLRDVFYRYTPKTPFAIEDISLTLSLGEIVGIIGKNGAGKTTLARLLTGMLRPQSGNIAVNKKSIADQSIAEIATKIGYVFQNPNQMLFTNTVEKELQLSLLRLELEKREKEERINRILAFFDLSEYRNVHPRFLSRGEKQKLALAIVLVQEPDVIILDEPFSGIDLAQREIISEYLCELKHQEKLIIIITHDLTSLIDYSERIIGLHNGKLQYNLPLQDFLVDRTNLRSIELEEPSYLAMIYSLQKYGLPKNIFRRKDLIHYFAQKKKAING
jgi:energy-coupling factor transport system ATP-binding protein